MPGSLFNFVYRIDLNLPVAVFEQNDFRAVFLNTGHGNIFAADHKVNMDQRVVHAQLAVFLFASFGRADQRFSISLPPKAK